MPTTWGPATTVVDGLVYCFDVANPRCYTQGSSTYFDISPNNHDGVIVGSPTFSSINQGILIFSGGNYVSANNPVVTSSFTGLTVEAFFYTTTKVTELLVENGTSYTNNSFYLAKENSTEFSFEVWGGDIGGSQNYHAVFLTTPYNTNTWYHLVGTWSSGSSVNLYLNASATPNRYQGSTRYSIRTGNRDFHIARRPDSPSLDFKGAIPVVRVYNRALSLTEAAQNYNALRKRFGV